SSKQFTARVNKKLGTSIGSHGYSAIEQIRDGKAYPASDLFSLGATCFHLLTGVSPFQLWMEHGYSWVKNWQDYLRSPITNELTNIINKLLEINLQNRYHSTDEVIRDLSKQYTHLLAPAKNSFLPTSKPGNFYPPKYLFLRNLLLILTVLVFLGLGEFGYRNFHQLQTAISSRFSKNKMAENSQPVVYQNPQTLDEDVVLRKKITEINKNKKIASVIITPNAKTIASSVNKSLQFWDTATGKEIITLAGHEKNINKLAVTPDGKILVSASDDKTLKIWDLETGKVIHTLIGHSDAVHDLTISKDGKILVSASDDKTLKIWNLKTGELIRSLKGHSDWVRSVDISDDGKTFASGSFDKTIQIWHLDQEKPIDSLTPNYQTVTSLAFSPDGNILASASRDRAIKLWDLKTKKIIHTLPIEHNATSLVFSPNGNFLVSANRNCSNCKLNISYEMKVWNVKSGKKIFTFTGHDKSVHSLAFSADGKTLVSGGDDHQIKVWDFSF
ncbi:MAG: serine/threonine protein kinase, partial [Sphaerospermopsis sp. SIO1G2]|nr:serine/threonine protein kinase [Sphaerospermopsis sp. SIO1G2]